MDVCVITKDSTDYLRNHVRPNERGVKEKSYKYPRGTTAVLKESITKFVTVSDIIRASEPREGVLRHYPS